MKTKLHTLLAVATALGSTIASAQDQRRPDQPQPPRPDGQRPGEGARRPDGDRPQEGQRRPDGERPPGLQQEGRARPDGERPQGARPPIGQEGGPRPDGERQLQRPDGQQRPMMDRIRQPEGMPRGGSPGEPMRPQQPPKPSAYLGVITTPVSPQLGAQLGLPEGFGLVVEEVLPDSPAKTAGVERFDVLKQLGDQKLTDPGHLAKLVRAAGKDTEIALTIVRKGQEQKITVKVGEKLMPERRMPAVIGDLQRKLRESSGPAGERLENMQRKMQERMKDFQERMRDFQKKLEEWRKNPSSPAPEPPKLEAEKFGATEPGGPLPPDVLREMRPGGAAQITTGGGDGATTRWNTASARVMIKDDTGEIQVSSQDGHRTVVAKNPGGDTVFTGPIDTPEQRQAIPEDIRRKLDKIEVRTRIDHPQAPPAGPGGDDNLTQNFAEPEIQ